MQVAFHEHHVNDKKRRRATSKELNVGLAGITETTEIWKRFTGKS